MSQNNEVVLFAGTAKESAVSHPVLRRIVRGICDEKKRRGEVGEYRKVIQRYSDVYKGSTGIDVGGNGVVRIAYRTGLKRDTLTDHEVRVAQNLVEGECADWADTIWKALVDRATASSGSRAEVRPSVSPPPSQPLYWADALHTRLDLLGSLFQVEYTNQEQMKDIAGEYLILRRLRPEGYLVSHATITAGNSDRQPGIFQTESVQRAFPPDAPIVDGIVYLSGRFLFSLGKIQDTSEFRAGIIRQRPRSPAGIRSTHRPRWDLIGIRLGMGPDGNMPQSYRIWCARLDAALTDAQRERLVKRHTTDEFEKHAELTTLVFEFDEAVMWLNGPNDRLEE